MAAKPPCGAVLLCGNLGPRHDNSPSPYIHRPQAHVDVASISQLASPAGSGFSLFTHVSQSLRSIDRSESTHFIAKSQCPQNEPKMVGKWPPMRAKFLTTTNVTYWGTVLGSKEGVYVLLGLCRRNPYYSGRALGTRMYGDLSRLRWTWC